MGVSVNYVDSVCLDGHDIKRSGEDVKEIEGGWLLVILYRSNLSFIFVLVYFISSYSFFIPVFLVQFIQDQYNMLKCYYVS